MAVSWTLALDESIFPSGVMNIEYSENANLTRIEPLWLHGMEPLWLLVDFQDGSIVRIRFSLERPAATTDRPRVAILLKKVLLGEKLQETGLRFRFGGTAFQKRVWAETCRIPPGSLISYGALASRISCGSPRAVGQALKANPLPIIIPCHRVTGSNGGLGGFSAGLEVKRILIDFESGYRESPHEDRNFK